MTNNRPTTDQQPTSNRPQYNKDNNILNYTKLNLLFNYLIYKEKKFENLKDSDRESIIAVLERLELYPVSEYMSEEKINDLKVQYWAITEIYLSPYKIYLNNIKNKKFLFRFLKAKKYVDYMESEQELNHFMRYFIKSLQRELNNEKGE